MIDIRPFTAEHVREVQAFNRRLAERGIDFQFPESPVSDWLPRREGLPLYQEHFVALDDGIVRGGYILKPQAFTVAGQTRMIADLQLPLSEGVIDGRYAMLGMQLVKDALAREPLLFGLGMGGAQQPVARLLAILRWRVVPCPFFFRVVHPFRFLREIVHLRQKRSRRLLLDALAWSGLGWLGARAAHWWKTSRPAGRAEAEVVSDFSSWADHLWVEAVGKYSLIALRDSVILNALYPPGHPRFLRLRVTRGGEPVGWAVLLDTPMTNHKQFGNLRVGSVVDCLARPGEEPWVVALATRHLRQRGVDLIVSNQLHRAWGVAFRQAGYLGAPSNFLFAASPALAALLDPFETHVERIHMTRGDGDGPIHL
jgi:hypothetical protein